MKNTKTRFAEFLIKAHADWSREQLEKDITAKTTRRAFFAWLGMPEQTGSDLTQGLREPSDYQIRRVGKKLPQVYAAIGREDLRDWDEAKARKEARLAHLARVANRLPERDVAKLAQLAESLLPSKDEQQEDSDRQGMFLAKQTA